MFTVSPEAAPQPAMPSPTRRRISRTSPPWSTFDHSSPPSSENRYSVERSASMRRVIFSMTSVSRRSRSSALPSACATSCMRTSFFCSARSSTWSRCRSWAWSAAIPAVPHGNYTTMGTNRQRNRHDPMLTCGPVRSRWTTLGALFVGYVGVYLCRKNLGVAVPLLQDAFHASKADVGWIASVGEIAYAAGKFLLGPPTERIGGRAAFLGVIGLVALFGGLGGIVPGIALLTVVYGLNRFFGACGWMSMMKVTATWYPHDRATGPVTFLSLSYVLGGVAATLVARALVPWEWHAVMGAPAIATVGLFVVAAAFVWEGP